MPVIIVYSPPLVSVSAILSLASSLDWDPLGLGPSATPAEDSGTSAAVIDPNVVLLAARPLPVPISASFYSLPSTTISETDTEGDSPNDTIMHKGVHYEMTIRNTFISFGVSDTAKRRVPLERPGAVELTIYG
eukprot:s347_g9.t1